MKVELIMFEEGVDYDEDLIFLNNSGEGKVIL